MHTYTKDPHVSCNTVDVVCFYCFYIDVIGLFEVMEELEERVAALEEGQRSVLPEAGSHGRYFKA